MNIYISEDRELVVGLNDNVLSNATGLKLLEAKTADKTTEKHVPVVKIKGEKVTVVVGDVLHPMTEEHQILYILVETNKGTYIQKLKSTDEPKATFNIPSTESVLRVYEYCNLHGLWEASEIIKYL
ncbi:MAG: desulfoferrodoxin family protein [Clostridium sp.]